MNDIADAAGVSHGTVYTVLESPGRDPRQVIDELLVGTARRLGTSVKDPMTAHGGGQPPLLLQASLRQLATAAGHRIAASGRPTPNRHRADEFRQRYHARVSTALRLLAGAGAASRPTSARTSRPRPRSAMHAIVLAAVGNDP